MFSYFLLKKFKSKKTLGLFLIQIFLLILALVLILWTQMSLKKDSSVLQLLFSSPSPTNEAPSVQERKAEVVSFGSKKPFSSLKKNSSSKK